MKRREYSDPEKLSDFASTAVDNIRQDDLDREKQALMAKEASVAGNAETTSQQPETPSQRSKRSIFERYCDKHDE